LDDIDHCWERLRNLADHARTDPREQAADIVESFKAQASQNDVKGLKHRVLGELAAKTRPGPGPGQVVHSRLIMHSQWLAVLEAAKAALS
jgi:hypothetical protein